MKNSHNYTKKTSSKARKNKKRQNNKYSNFNPKNIEKFDLLSALKRKVKEDNIINNKYQFDFFSPKNITKVTREPGWTSENESDTENDCIICLNVIRKSEQKSLNCNHVFHSGCIIKWLEEKEECPVCRQNTSLKLKSEGLRYLMNSSLTNYSNFISSVTSRFSGISFRQEDEFNSLDSSDYSDTEFIESIYGNDFNHSNIDENSDD